MQTSDPKAQSPPARPTRWARLQARSVLLTDTLAVFSSLMINGVLGFVFWVAAARLYPPAAVGIGSALTSVMYLMGNISRLGLDFALTLALPKEQSAARRHALIQGSLLIVAAMGMLVTAAFIGQPWVAAETRSVFWHDPPMAAGFVTVCGLWGLGLVLEQILLVSRRSATILRKNLAFSLIKLGALPVALLLVGPEQGIIVATELGVVAGLLATWLPLRHLMTWRWRLMYSGVAEIRTSLAGSALGNQVSALIAGLPNWLLPLIVTERGGAGEAAYFYTSWMIMTLVNTGPSALAVSLLAEGARQGGGSTHLIGKAYRYTGLFMVPATLAVAVGAPYVLPIFGHEYAGNGLELLRYLALAGLPYAVVQINFTKLRLDGKHLCLSGTAALLAAGTLLGSYLLLPAWGLVAVGLSWLGSCLVVAVLSGWFMGRPPAQRRAQT